VIPIMCGPYDVIQNLTTAVGVRAMAGGSLPSD